MLNYIKRIFDEKDPACFGRHACAVILWWIMTSAWLVMIDDWRENRDLFIPDIPTQWVVIALALFAIAAGKESVTAFAKKELVPENPPIVEAKSEAIPKEGGQ